jgi:hypothetical protein
LRDLGGSPRAADFLGHQFTNKSNFAPFEIPNRSATGELFFVTPTDQDPSGESGRNKWRIVNVPGLLSDSTIGWE